MQGFLTRAFSKLLEEDGGRISLNDAIAHLQSYRKLQDKDVRVVASGETFKMASVVSTMEIAKGPEK